MVKTNDIMDDTNGEFDYLNSMGQKKNSKPGLIVFIAASIMFGMMAVVGLLEMIVAFYRNTHIFGFIVAFFLFAIGVSLLALLTFYYLKGDLPQYMWIPFYVLFGVGMVLFLLTAMFLSIKMMSYSQEPSRATDFKVYTLFSEDCHNAMKKCSTSISVQSRVEGAKVVSEQGLAMYVQTSHTGGFLGLIKDGVYWMTAGGAPEGNDDKICLNGDTVCLYAECTKRIASSPIS